MIHPRTWKHDSASTFCMDCRRPFALLRRRHHCRHCGGLFCADCTAQRLWLRPIFDPLMQRKPELTCNSEPTSHTEAVVRTSSSSTSSDSSSRGSNTVQTTTARKIDSNGGMSGGNNDDIDEAAVPIPLKSCEASATQPRIGAVTDVATLVTQRSSTTMALTCSGTLVIEDNTEQINMLDTYNTNDDSEGSGRSPDVLQQTTRQVQGDELVGQQPLTPPTTAHTLNGEEESKRWMLWDEAEVGERRGEVVATAHATPARDTSAHSSLSTPTSHASAPQEAQRATTSDLTPRNTAANNNTSSTSATQQQQQQEMQDDRLWWLWNPIAHQSREGTWWFLARVCRTCYTELMNGLSNTSPTTTATTSSTALCRRRSTTSSKRAGLVRVGGRPLARFATATLDGEEDDSVNNDVCADRAVDDPVEEVEEDEEETPSLTSLFAAAWGALRRRVKSQSRQSSEVDMGAISSTTTTTSATSEAAEERHVTMKRAQQQQQQRAVTVAMGGKPSRMAGHDEVRGLPQAEASHATTTLLAARTARDLARITALARRERRVCVVLIDERGSARREAMQPAQEPAQMRWYGITNTTTTTTSSSHSTVERVGEERATMRHPPSCSSPPQSSRVSGNSSFIMEVSGAGNALPFPAPRQSPLRADNTTGCTPEHGGPMTPSHAQRSRSNSTSTLLAPVLPACTDRHRSRYHTLHLLLNELQDNNNIHSNSTAMSSDAGGGGSAAMASEVAILSHTASGVVQRSSASQQLQRTGQERLSLMAAQRPQPRSPCLQAGGTVLLAAIQQQAATNARRQPSPHHSVPSSDPTSESRSMTGNATSESYSHATTMIGAAVMGPGGQRLGSSLSTLHQGSASCSCGPSWAAEAALTDHFSSAGHHRRSMQRRIVLELPVKLCFPAPTSTSQQQGQAKAMNGLPESNMTTTITRDDKGHSEAVTDTLAPIRRSTRMPLLSPPVSPMLQRGKGPVIVVHSPHMNASSTTAAAQEGVVPPPPLPTPCQLPGAAVGSFGRVTSASDVKGTRAMRPQVTTATPPPPTVVAAGGGTVSVASVAARVELMGLVASPQDGLESGPAVSAMVNASRPFPFALFAHDASAAGMGTGGPGTSSAAAAAVATAAAAGSGTGTSTCSAHLCPLLQQLTSVSVRTHAYLFVILRGESPSGLTQGEQATMSYSALDALYDPSMPEFARPGVARRASATMQASLMRSATYNISTGAGSSHTGAAGGATPSSSHSQHAASSHAYYYNNSSGNGGNTSMGSNGVADLYARPSRRPFSGAELYHVYQHIQSCGGSVPPMAVLDVGPHVTRHRPHTSTTTIAEEGIINNNNFTGANKAAHNVSSARLTCHEMWGTAADRTRRHSGGSMMDLARAHDAGAALAMNSVKQMARRLGLQYTRHHYPSETSVDVKAHNAPIQGEVSGSNVCTDEETLRSISQLLTSEEDCASPLPSTTTTPLQAATPQYNASCDTSCFQAALRGVVATLVQRDLRALQQCGE